jgi:hypothetical protein
LKGGPRHKQKMQSLCLFKKKKPFFVCVVALPSKRFFLSTIFCKDTNFEFFVSNTIFVRKTFGKRCFPWKTFGKVPENLNLVSFQKMQSLCLFKKKNHFLFVSWPSLQIPFLLGKPSFSKKRDG